MFVKRPDLALEESLINDLIIVTKQTTITNK